MKYLILLITIITITSCIHSDTYDTFKEIDKVILNSKVVIGADTLDVINTHWFKQSVTLSDHNEYAYNYIETKFANDSTRLKIEELNNNLK